MAKLKLAVDPTFRAKVAIPLPGKDAPIDVEFEFCAMTRDELEKFVDERAEREDESTLKMILRGWEFEDELCDASIALLLQRFIGVARPITEKFLTEITKARLGN